MIALALTGALLFSVYRLVLLSSHVDDVLSVDLAQLVRMFVIGVRFDLSVMGGLCAPLILLFLVLPQRWLRGFGNFYTAFVIGLLSFAEIAGLYFFEYYGFRLNYLVLDHGTDHEVLGALVGDYPLGWIALTTLASAWVAVGVARFIERMSIWHRVSMFACGRSDLRGRMLVLALVPLCFAAIRGTVGHRPLNPSLAAFSTDRILNELAGSGVYNVAYEIDQRLAGRYVRVSDTQPVADEATALLRARSLLGDQGGWVRGAHNPLLREVRNTRRERPLNVVLVVMESFTAQLVGALGGDPAISPEFDTLAERGVLLENCYATGERTVQGLEAIVSSFPPLPGVSVVRRPEARSHFATLASVLAARGYKTVFFYGGEGHFDQMRGFFRGNGFEHFREERDFEAPAFRGSWGVSDEDVFREADATFRQLTRSRTPFFGVILTVSLHSPWEYPEGRIGSLSPDVPIPAGFKYDELNNFRYADYALGEFMRKAEEARYFEDTVFVFVGDHGVHLRGRDLIPSEEYRVAALLIAPGYLAPRRIARVTSQLDIAPTIMGILGGDYRSPFYGRNVLEEPNAPGFAPMIYRKRAYGVRRDDRLTVLGEGGTRTAYRVGGLRNVERTSMSQPHADDADGLLAMVQTAEQQLLGRSFRID